MGLKGNFEVIGGLLQERKETEKEEQILQEEIDRLRRQRELIAAELAAENSAQDSVQVSAENYARHSARKAETLRALDQQIEKLTKEREEQIRKRKDICKIARTVTAGD